MSRPQVGGVLPVVPQACSIWLLSAPCRGRCCGRRPGLHPHRSILQCHHQHSARGPANFPSLPRALPWPAGLDAFQAQSVMEALWAMARHDRTGEGAGQGPRGIHPAAWQWELRLGQCSEHTAALHAGADLHSQPVPTPPPPPPPPLLASPHAVLACIHQPRSSIYHMFDQLLLLSDGRTIFFGPASEATPYFAQLGFVCPPMFNPADVSAARCCCVLLALVSSLAWRCVATAHGLGGFKVPWGRLVPPPPCADCWCGAAPPHPY